MPKKYAVWFGTPYPLGATWDGLGVNFALFSERAEKVELCLFDESGQNEVARIPMPDQTDQIWHAYLPEARPGLKYAYRVYGPYKPEEGQRFNPNKLLLDPYAKAIVGDIKWDDAHFAYKVGDPQEDLSFDERDSAPFTPKGVVVEQAFSWGKDAKLDIPWHETIIYEMHVKGFSKLNHQLPEELRGTYAGLGSEPAINYFKRLGVTSLELMPVHTFADDRYLVEKGLRNYWGYNSIGFFAPDMRYSATGQIAEFKTMVKALHAAGIEVILDVVYNHTAEGNHLGPTLSFRGIDNAAYYRLVNDDPRHYMDYTGCGNSLNMDHPRVLQLIMDSLRYWIMEMHVDGFRFDLASTLARELHEVNRLGSFFDIICQDPIISQTKLIAEPWDLGEGGYQVGNFPPGWAEWNDKYRDCMRRYWKGDGGQIGELAYRLTGSSDLYALSGRRPVASINFITAHDGFTLNDLVSYNEKHNEANLEDNKDGSDNNQSWNCGVEGPTDDPEVFKLRTRQKKNFLATLMLSQGVPMLLMGDEVNRSQMGNNNAYCQDNEITWMRWDFKPEDRELFKFVRDVLAFRKSHPILHRAHFFQGRPIHGTGIKDILWLNSSGQEMNDEEWEQAFTRCLGVFFAGSGLTEMDERGRPLVDDNMLILLSSHHEEIPFKIPELPIEGSWEVAFDTSDPKRKGSWFAPGDEYPLANRSFAVLLNARLEE
ncbi:MAG: glycogen debranching protein GlgX [Nitrospirota bacterium]|nr:glycogen debranching protein GlgX [Nitrospirota bacterium]